MLALALFTLLQALPLPARALAFASPAAAEVWARSVEPLAAPPPAWVALSLDPGATLVEVLKWLVYAAVATGASALAVRRGSGPVALTLFASACIVAAATLGHGLVGATRVWGIYEPSQASLLVHLGPLLNPNNAASYMNLGAIAGSGGTSRLTRLVGVSWAKYLAMAGVRIDAQRALMMGLVQDVFPEETFMDDVYAFCRRMMTINPEALGLAKLAIDMYGDVQDRTVQRHIDRMAVTLTFEEFEKSMQRFAKPKPTGDGDAPGS
jgi:hypothetical protein